MDGVLEQGWDELWYRVKTDLFELRLLPGADEDLQALDNLDAEVWMPDGNRWSATILTIDEVHRLMIRWQETGERSSGLYWHCPDGLIVREPGIDCITEAVTEIVRAGLLSEVLQLVGTWPGNQAVDGDRQKRAGSTSQAVTGRLL